MSDPEDIKAGRREIGECPSCGAPWVRKVTIVRHRTPEGWKVEKEPAGWMPSCWCGCSPVKVAEVAVSDKENT